MEHYGNTRIYFYMDKLELLTVASNFTWTYVGQKDSFIKALML